MPSRDARHPISEDSSSRYEEAGVDRSRAARIIDRFRSLAAATHGAGVISGIGGFGGVIAAPGSGGDTVLVASIDSVGTKTLLAGRTGLWRNIGYDIVSHCVNDVLVQGADPLFFLDYVAMSRLDVEAVHGMAEGMAEACQAAGCALLGGETAEMPGVYAPGDAELVGVLVGSVARDGLLDGSRIQVGDRLVGLASTGLHTNGYTLARRIVEERSLDLAEPVPPLDRPLGEALMATHRLYLEPVRPLLRRGIVHGMAHITGGGLVENVPRVLPEGTAAVVRPGTWPVPPIFRLLQEQGRIADNEMLRVFNMGIGWVLMIGPGDLDAAVAALGEEGRDGWIIGEVIAGDRGVRISDSI